MWQSFTKEETFAVSRLLTLFAKFLKSVKIIKQKLLNKKKQKNKQVNNINKQINFQKSFLKTGHSQKFMSAKIFKIGYMRKFMSAKIQVCVREVIEKFSNFLIFYHILK